MKTLLALLLAFPFALSAQEKAELIGQLGGRTALLVVQGTQRADGGWQLTGEYIVFPTLARRYLEGERGPELGVTTLKEGTSSILFGREPIGELRGTWRGGAFKGMRYGPGGQERERFEFSEEFPPMDQYSAAVQCQAGDGWSLNYVAEGGRLKSFEWRSPACALTGLAQQPFKGGLRLASGSCAATLREVGAEVKVDAEQCAQQCAASFAALLVDRRGACRVLRPEAR
jgi:hypothetical protein